MRNTSPTYRKKEHLGPRRPRRCPCAWRRTPHRSRCSSQPRPGGRACDHADPASHRCGGAERRPGWFAAWREANRSSARKRESQRPIPLRRRSAQIDDTRRYLASNGFPWPGSRFTEHASIRIPAPSPNWHRSRTPPPGYWATAYPQGAAPLPGCVPWGLRESCIVRVPFPGGSCGGDAPGRARNVAPAERAGRLIHDGARPDAPRSARAAHGVACHRA